MKKVYIGIDLGSKTCAAAAFSQRGTLLDSEQFKTSERNLIGFVTRQEGRAKVLVEECDLADWVLRVLEPYAESVEACDAKRNRWIAMDTVKSDPGDAKKLGELLRVGSYSPVYHSPDHSIVTLRQAVKQYDHLKKRIVGQKSRIKAHLRQQGILTEGSRVYGSRGREDAMGLVSDEAIVEILRSDYRILDALTCERNQMLKLLSSLSARFAVIPAYLKMPGVGVITACRFAAYVQTPHRFSNVGGLCKYSALGVAGRSSGGKQLSRRRLDKAGNAALKDVSRTIFEAAMRRHDNNLFKRSFQESLARTGNADHARLSTQRKILAVMRAMWRDGTEYCDGYCLVA